MNTSDIGGGWLGSELADRPYQWRLPIPETVAEELVQAAQASSGAPFDPSAPRPAALRRTAEFAAEVRSQLQDGLGFVVVTDFPVNHPEPVVQAAYWTFGNLLGRPVSQSRKGDLIGRVEDRGADISSPVQRGYESSAALPFHADRTDVIGLLCVHPACAGGLSRLVSSKALHDLVRQESPAAFDELYGEFPNDRRGEEKAGAAPWTNLPVFARVGDSFAARYVRRFIEGSQRHDDAPRLTAGQTAALDLLDEILDRPGVSLDMELRRGDLQLINNFHILHARSAFTDAPGRHGRLLLRLWLAFAGSPQLPPSYRDLYGAVSAGSYRGGVWPADALLDDIGSPVN